ncbi:fimbrial protein [Pseudomonas faucium]|uniref:fimbrial protein n=1 Tax=Pseudomonas faucium TaxID=2740518 RepID=UPI001F26AD1F|nr:fimbrial protein [Pseudomonas faucium]
MSAPRLLRPTLALWLAGFLATASAQEVQCYWDGGLPTGRLHYNIQLGMNWVPRDAPIGTVIATWDRLRTMNDGLFALMCPVPVPGLRADVNMPSTARIFPGSLPPINGRDLTGRVLETSVPGVGLHVYLDFPYNGLADNAWKPTTWRSIPYVGSITTPSPVAHRMTYLDAEYTLIKIGDIPAGPNDFAGQELFTGTFTTVGNVLRANLFGSVHQAQCSLQANAVSADPVDLGSHEASSFTQEGTVTASVPFHINLNNCEDDPNGGTARVHVELEVAKGATVIDADRGLFSLSPEADSAQGLGIQILHADGVSPAVLHRELDVTPISPGDMRIDFNARYYQTAPTVRAGVAKSALNFTLYYK